MLVVLRFVSISDLKMQKSLKTDYEMCIVPDRRSRIIPEVVLVRRGQLGFWEFGGGRVWVKGWVKGGQFTSNLRPWWTGPVTARRVPSK
jgi:hypothetical protein